MAAIAPDVCTIGGRLMLRGLKKKAFAPNGEWSVRWPAIGGANHVEANASSGAWLPVERGDKGGSYFSMATFDPTKPPASMRNLTMRSMIGRAAPSRSGGGGGARAARPGGRGGGGFFGPPPPPGRWSTSMVLLFDVVAAAAAAASRAWPSGAAKN
jgi:hypothetical protein